MSDTLRIIIAEDEAVVARRIARPLRMRQIARPAPMSTTASSPNPRGQARISGMRSMGEAPYSTAPSPMRTAFSVERSLFMPPTYAAHLRIVSAVGRDPA